MMKNYCMLFITIACICPSALHAEKFNPHQYGHKCSYETEEEFSIRMQRECAEQKEREERISQQNNVERTRNVLLEERIKFIGHTIFTAGVVVAAWFTWRWYGEKSNKPEQQSTDEKKKNDAASVAQTEAPSQAEAQDNTSDKK